MSVLYKNNNGSVTPVAGLYRDENLFKLLLDVRNLTYNGWELVSSSVDLKDSKRILIRWAFSNYRDEWCEELDLNAFTTGSGDNWVTFGRGLASAVGARNIALHKRNDGLFDLYHDGTLIYLQIFKVR